MRPKTLTGVGDVSFFWLQYSTMSAKNRDQWSSTQLTLFTTMMLTGRNQHNGEASLPFR